MWADPLATFCICCPARFTSDISLRCLDESSPNNLVVGLIFLTQSSVRWVKIRLDDLCPFHVNPLNVE